MPGLSEKYKAIVIGTSAGGLFALSSILETFPSNYSIPIIIVQHRIKDQRDLLEEVLQVKCKIKIKQADEKEVIKGGVVYIAPPDYHLLVEEDKTFSLSADAAVRFGGVAVQQVSVGDPVRAVDFGPIVHSAELCPAFLSDTDHVVGKFEDEDRVVVAGLRRGDGDGVRGAWCAQRGGERGGGLEFCPLNRRQRVAP